MPTVFHPAAVEGVDGRLPSRVTVGGDNYAVDETGRVSLPDDRDVAELARAYDVAPEVLAPEFNQHSDEALVNDDPTCAGKDGECSRSVDDPGGYCWQHRPD